MERLLYKYACLKLKKYRNKKKMSDKDIKKMLKLYHFKNEYELEQRNERLK